MNAPNSPNIELGDSAFAERLTRLRLARRMTVTELAQAAGLSDRTVRDIEKGRRNRVQEATLIALAGSLDVDLDELLLGQHPAEAVDAPAPDPDPPRVRRRLSLSLLAVTALVVVLVLTGLLVRDDEPIAGPADLPVDPEQLTEVLRDRWGAEHQSGIAVAQVLPTPDGPLYVYGLDGANRTDFSVVARDRDGNVLWSDHATSEQIIEVYGDNSFFQIPCRVTQLSTCDMDGDGELEIVAVYGHLRLYPGFVRIYAADGTILGAYYNYGRIGEMLVVDVENDGRDELLLLGTNNSPHYQSGTAILLDAEHRNGASSDPLGLADCPLPDDCRVRIVMPRFPEHIMAHFKGLRLWLRYPTFFREADGEAIITAGLMIDQTNFLVIFDGDLNPVAIEAADGAVSDAVAWPAEDQAFIRPESLEAWARGLHRFGARGAS